MNKDTKLIYEAYDEKEHGILSTDLREYMFSPSHRDHRRVYVKTKDGKYSPLISDEQFENEQLYYTTMYASDLIPILSKWKKDIKKDVRHWLAGSPVTLSRKGSGMAHMIRHDGCQYIAYAHEVIDHVDFSSSGKARAALKGLR